MALTKVTGQVIKNTTDVTVGVLTVTNTLAVGGTVSIGGTLTYEDVTNVDAVGLITARNGIVVGSGITLSKDGDVFFTGIATGNGSGLTALNASNLGSGTVPTARLGSGTASSSTFLRGDSTFAAVTSTTINNNAANRLITGSGTANTLNGNTYATWNGSNLALRSGEGEDCSIELASDEGDDNADFWRAMVQASDNVLAIDHYESGSWAEKLRIESDGDLRLSSGDSNTNYAFIRGWQSSTGDMIIGADQSATGTNGSNLIFRTRGSEKVRIEQHGNLKVSKNLSVTGIATVGSAVTISESGIEASGIGITVANINGSSTGSKNLIINGAMNVAQYDLSEGNGTITTSSGHLCDRWKIQQGGIDENARMEHVDVGSSDTGPYEEGFRKSLKIQNGDQTSGAGAADFIELYQYIEGDQMLTSGWDYKNPNSKLTISMWVKSTVAQTFPGFVYTTSNGSSVHYMYDYVIGNGTSNLTANTWTKVKHTLPGNSNLVITAGTGYGLGFGIFPFQGTNYTTSRSASNAWQAWDSNNKVPDLTTTWYTTNNAQLYITGVQLEVGEEATPYKHKHITEEQMMCKRYFQVISPSAADHMMFGFGRAEGNTARIGISVPVPMRAVPTVICSNNRAVKYDATMTQSTTTPSVYNSGSVDLDSNIMTIDFGGHSSLSHNNVYIVTSDSGGSLQLSAEL